MGLYNLDFQFDLKHSFDLEENLFQKDIYLYRRLLEDYKTYCYVIDRDVQTLVELIFVFGRFPYQININEISYRLRTKMYDKWFLFDFNTLWRVLRAMEKLEYIRFKLRKEFDTNNEDVIYYLDIKVITDLIDTSDLRAIEKEHNNIPYTDAYRNIWQTLFPKDKKELENKIYNIKKFHEKDKSIKTSMKLDFQVEDFHYETFDDELIFYHDMMRFHCLQIPSINL